MKTEIVVGDTLDFETSVPDYPNSDGWTLNFALTPFVTGAKITFAAAGTPSEDADGYRVQLAPATTAAWTAGNYSWHSYLSKSGARITLESGQVTLLPDPAVATAPLDNRSHARIMLADIEVELRRRAGKPSITGYTNGQRALQYETMENLDKLRDRALREVAKEDAAERLANGLAPKSKVVVRL